MERYQRLYEKDFVTRVGKVTEVGDDYIVAAGEKLTKTRGDVWPKNIKVGDKISLQGMSVESPNEVSYYISRKLDEEVLEETAAQIKKLAKKYGKDPRTVEKYWKKIEKGIKPDGEKGYGLVYSTLEKKLKNMKEDASSEDWSDYDRQNFGNNSLSAKTIVFSANTSDMALTEVKDATGKVIKIEDGYLPNFISPFKDNFSFEIDIDSGKILNLPPDFKQRLEAFLK